MPSGIYIDDQFIGVTWHSVDVYFDVIRAVIDSGQSRRLLLPHDDGDGATHFLITPATRLRAVVDCAEDTTGAAEGMRDAIAEHPFGNFPAIAKAVLDADSHHWEFLRHTALGAAIDAAEDEETAEPRNSANAHVAYQPTPPKAVVDPDPISRMGF